ncbi:MAG: CHASE2 domain-containing protein [Cyanobacteria bacterium J06621_15]
MESIITSKIIDNWEAHDEPEHLKTIRDRMLLGEQIAGRFLGLYQQILLKGYINADNSLENMRFRLLGLVVKEDRIIKVYNQIYKSVFNLDWVEKELGKLRPYSESFQAWVDSNYQDESRLLRGKSLQNALVWANKKNLSNEDARYLSASQELEKAELTEALAAREEETRILAKANEELRQAQYKFKQADETLKRAKKEFRFTQILVISFLVTSLVMGVRYLGFLQPSELHAYDRFMQLRSQYFPELRDPHLLIVTIDEQDIQYQQDNYNDMQDSLSDKALADLLVKLDNQYKVNTVGLDLHRTHKVQEESPNFTNPYTNKHLFVTCKAPTSGNDGDSEGIRPPSGATPERIGFSDFVADDDDVARRHLLSMSINSTSKCNTEEALSIRLALDFLDKLGKKAHFRQVYLEINNTTAPWESVLFKTLENRTSGYQKVDSRGHQILLNYRSLPSVDQIAETVSLRDVLNKPTQSEAVKTFRDRIALIGRVGVTNPWKTPFSSGGIRREREVPGVFVQAQMVSQIISSVLYDRPLLWWWSTWKEAIWVWGWSFIGDSIVWLFSKPLHRGLSLTVSFMILFLICFGIFVQSGWIPFIPSALVLLSSPIATVFLASKFKIASRRE